MALGVRFQKLRGGWLLSRGVKFSEGQGELNSQMGLDSLELLFFCKSVISVATLLLIIRITTYILLSLIQNIFDP